MLLKLATEPRRWRYESGIINDYPLIADLRFWTVSLREVLCLDYTEFDNYSPKTYSYELMPSRSLNALYESTLSYPRALKDFLSRITFSSCFSRTKFRYDFL